MSEVEGLFEPLRFPGDDYSVRFNAQQLLQLCQLLEGIRQSNAALFEEPNTLMIELQLAHQLFVHQLRFGSDEEKYTANQQLGKIRMEMLRVSREMRA